MLISSEYDLFPCVSSPNWTIPNFRYAHMKKDVFHEGKQGKVLSLGELLLAAGSGGVPAGE
jgi:hypothetical protein